jgi:hypothetical protein
VKTRQGQRIARTALPHIRSRSSPYSLHVPIEFPARFHRSFVCSEVLARKPRQTPEPRNQQPLRDAAAAPQISAAPDLSEVQTGDLPAVVRGPGPASHLGGPQGIAFVTRGAPTAQRQPETVNSGGCSQTRRHSRHTKGHTRTGWSPPLLCPRPPLMGGTLCVSCPDRGATRRAPRRGHRGKGSPTKPMRSKQ